MIEAAPTPGRVLEEGVDSYEDWVGLASRAACRGLEVFGSAEDLRGRVEMLVISLDDAAARKFAGTRGTGYSFWVLARMAGWGQERRGWADWNLCWGGGIGEFIAISPCRSSP